MTKRITTLILLTICYGISAHSQSAGNLDLIPRPTSVTPEKGTFAITPQTHVFTAAVFSDVATLFSETAHLQQPQLALMKMIPLHSVIFAAVDKSVIPDSAGYQLRISPDYVSIFARTQTGALNGMQSVLQLRLLQPDQQTLPCATITDHPRFGYRGVHLDVSRNFFPAAYVKRFLDLMALYKMNTFHWHLTDGAGWRLEIKRYPELTRNAAWRNYANWKDWWTKGRR